MHLNDSNIIVEITIDYYVLYYGIVTVNNEFGLKIILKKLFLRKAKLVRHILYLSDSNKLAGVKLSIKANITGR